MQSIADNIELSLESCTVAGLSVALVSDSTLKYLWALVNSAQIISVMPLIDVPMPSNAMIFFRMISIANGDFKIMERLPNLFREKNLLSYHKLEQQQPLSENCEFAGYEAGSFFLLQELKILLLLYYLAFLVTLVLVSFILKRSPRW